MAIPANCSALTALNLSRNLQGNNFGTTNDAIKAVATNWYALTDLKASWTNLTVESIQAVALSLQRSSTARKGRNDDVTTFRSSEFFPTSPSDPNMNACDIKGIVCLAKVYKNPGFLCPSSGFRGKLTLNERFGRHLRPNFTGISFYGLPRPQDGCVRQQNHRVNVNLTNVVKWYD